ncbi:FkbM family methyltransferase [Mucilaginibacter phyllosphaerae]|nr:FkbM family methyltransferase [Mucilaginibacter phyllosphaerae]TEW67518.1 FkbM family methyltransferase [Mucilaginibacter phyllosphaerae]GGH13513.1 hypothetical protein GCM10007352_20990 [Mucilaginibacter phyllosphaerae]
MITHDLQQQIFGMAKNCGLFIDIGCNVGVMTIGALLHHQQLKAIALDPSQTAVKLVKRSVKANKLGDRCTVVNAAVGDADGTAHFTDSLGNAMAAVQADGDIVKQLSLSNILNAYPDVKKLVKIDTEGFETVILKDLDNVKNKQDVTFIIEVHNLGYNNGNPSQVFSMLKKQDAIIKSLNGEEITSLPDGEISQILVSF